MNQDEDKGPLSRMGEQTLDEAHTYDDIDMEDIMEQLNLELLAIQAQDRMKLSDRSPTLENRNVVHPHSATQSTSLAYVRTSLECAAAGVVLVRFISMTPMSILLSSSLLGKALGSVIEVLGVGILTIAVHRHLTEQRELIEKILALASAVVCLVVFGMVIITCIMFWLFTFGLMFTYALSLLTMVISISVVFGLMLAVAACT